MCIQVIDNLSAVLTDGELIIPTEVVCSIFDKSVDKIISAVQAMLSRAGGSCDYMLLVGGYAESAYLVQKLRTAFSASVRCKIVAPDAPSQSVLKGKLLYL